LNDAYVDLLRALFPAGGVGVLVIGAGRQVKPQRLFHRRWTQMNADNKQITDACAIRPEA